MAKRRKTSTNEQALPGFDEFLPSGSVWTNSPLELHSPPQHRESTEAFETGYANLQGLLEQINPGSRNEATTRLHLIDRVFFECLGWRREHCVTEEPHGAEYADYVLSFPWKTIVIEAKREGKYFELPISKRNACIRDLKPLLGSCPELFAAATQVAGYNQSRGVPIAIVTNGFPMVCFIGSRTDGIPPLHGKALVFNSLINLKDNFVLAWNCLSPEGIATTEIYSKLLGPSEIQPPPKISSKIASFPGFKQRNSLQADLEIVSDIVFHDIIESRQLEVEFIEECYCKSGALSQQSNLTKSILSARYAQLFIDDQPAPPLLPAVSKHGTVVPELIAEGLSKRPIVLVGDVGAGKTTFLRKLICIDSKEIFDQSITLYVDLGRIGTLGNSIRDTVLDEIPIQLNAAIGINCFEDATVRGVYHKRLEEFGRGIYKKLKEIDLVEFNKKEIEFLGKLIDDKSNHIKNTISHIVRGRKKQVILILDNCDQRGEPEQQEAFLISEEIANSWDCVVFVTLRPETFNRSRRRGALTGYHPKVFSISPPRTDQMLEKRLRFAEKICSGDIPVESISLSAHFSSLLIFIKVVRQSLSANSSLSSLIDNLAAGNMRMALDLLRSFISSGHVNSQKILDIYSRSGNYTIPAHEFLRAIIFGNHIYYNPDSSPIVNLFQQWSNDQKEWFLVPRILSTVVGIGESGGADGFVDYPQVVDSLQRHGFNPIQINQAMHFCLTRKLLEAAGRLIPEVKQETYPGIRVTSFGKCHLTTLPKLFVYIDAMMTDFRLNNSSVSAQIAESWTLPERITAVKNLLNVIQTLEATIGQSNIPEEWLDAKMSLHQDIQKVEHAAIEQHNARKK